MFYSHDTGDPASDGTSSSELEDLVGAKFYCPHALADGNQCIRIREKMPEFSTTVLSTLSPYHTSQANLRQYSFQHVPGVTPSIRHAI